ncbi:unnamed protein product [Polarella glacialis]|uniref:C2 domain-containing protein n=1 Tax=Polarella glacialis TaxID=89957 RepID=A0A813DDX3_POLGL|nr:unnamed protein product [Polarella glacialis]
MASALAFLLPKPSTPLVLAAAGGAVAGGAAVAGSLYLKGLADSYDEGRLQRQGEIVADALQQSLSAEGVRLPSHFELAGLQQTLTPWLPEAPAYPQLKLAFDAILRLQTKRKPRADPKTVACELLKAWLREKAEDRGVPPREVLAYRNFCRALVQQKHALRGHSLVEKGSFVQAMAHVAHELDGLLLTRLRDAQSASQLLGELRGEAYSFLLHLAKLLLLSGANFTMPEAMYSLDSLALLRRTALSPELLHDKFDKGLASEMQSAWQTDCGLLVKLLLSQPHVAGLVTAHEGIETRAIRTSTLIVDVLRAEALPSTAVDTVDPYVTVKVVQGTRTLSSAKSSAKKNCENPTWGESLLVDIPDQPELLLPGMEPIELVVEVADYNVGGNFNCTFARSVPIGLPEVWQQATAATELYLEMEKITKLSPRGTLEGTRVVVCLRRPEFATEAARIQRSWSCEPGASSSEQSGLKFHEVGPAFLNLATALDNAAYFLDIAAQQAAEVTKLLGDLGAVLVAPLLCTLLNEVDQRTTAAELAAVALNDALMSRMVESARAGPVSMFEAAAAVGKRFSTSAAAEERTRQEASRSLEVARELRRRVLDTSADLRRICLGYQNVKGVLGEAVQAAVALLSTLHSKDTVRRSPHFAEQISEAEASEARAGESGRALLAHAFALK